MANPTDAELEAMSLEDLAKFAAEEAAQPRDEQGRFVAVSSEKEQPISEEVQADEPEEIVYRRVIDLGDGSGTQVFEAPSPAELIEKLATAQEHATRKIREQAQQLEQARNPKPVDTIDENEEFVLSQQFLQSPTKAFRELFQRNTGMTIEEFKATQSEAKQLTTYQREMQAAQQFVQSTPEYYNSPKNNAKIEKLCRVNGWPGTVENIQKAYADLAESGLLETAPQNNDAVDAATLRIARPVETVRRAASGTSSRRQPVVVATTPTEDDLYNMPLDKLAEMASRSRL